MSFIFLVFKNFICDIPGRPVVKNLPSEDMGSVPGWGSNVQILHAVWYGQKKQKNKRLFNLAKLIQLCKI